MSAYHHFAHPEPAGKPFRRSSGGWSLGLDLQKLPFVASVIGSSLRWSDEAAFFATYRPDFQARPNRRVEVIEI